MVKKGRRKPSPLPRTSKKVDHGSANEIRVIGQFFRLKRINNPQKLFSNMGKSNAVLLALGTFLGVVGRESRFVVNHRYDSLMMRDSKQDVADLLDEHEEKKSIQELLRKQQKPQTQRQRKSKRHEQER